MSAIVTLNWVRELEGQTFRVDYKKTSDLAWILVNGNLNAETITIPDLLDNTSYDFRIAALCEGGGTSSSQTITHVTPIPCGAPSITEIDIISTCPVGYTPINNGAQCQHIEIMPAVYEGGGSPYVACHYTYENYTDFAALFFKPNGYNVDGTYTVGNNPTQVTVGPLWANPTAVDTEGRLNAVGIWACGDQIQPVNTPIGFSRQIVLSQSKQYYIGIAADNFCTIKINGTTIIEQDVDALEIQWSGDAQVTFRYWFVYPVMLNAGSNFIELIGTNQGSIGIMGAEIYDATEAELIACSNQSELNPYIVFSTMYTFGEDFDIGNWTCTDPTFSLVYDPDTDSYSCRKVITIPSN